MLEISLFFSPFDLSKDRLFQSESLNCACAWSLRAHLGCLCSTAADVSLVWYNNSATDCYCALSQRKKTEIPKGTSVFQFPATKWCQCSACWVFPHHTYSIWTDGSHLWCLGISLWEVFLCVYVCVSLYFIDSKGLGFSHLRCLFKKVLMGM